MNKKLREIERASGLEIYGLGARRDKWEYTMEKFTELVIDDVLKILSDPVNYNKCVYTTHDADQAACVARELSNKIKEHFKAAE